MSSTGEAYGLFWNSENGDRTYDASSFEYWLKKFFTSGVFNGNLQVLANSGMTVSIGSGYTNVDGKVKFWDEAFTLTLDAANSTYPRIDTIVITRDNVNRQITCEKVTGAYSGDNPQPTAPVRNLEKYQLVIAQIYVGSGVTEITQSAITDTRPDTDLCGYITGTVTEMDFSQFSAQFEAYYNEFVAGNEADFDDWFDHMKDQLSEDAAGHLQLEVDDLQSQIDVHTGNISDINIDIGNINTNITGIDSEISDMNNILGAKNLCPNGGVTTAQSGVTYTVNSDGSVLVSGTATAGNSISLGEVELDAGTYKISTGQSVEQDSFIFLYAQRRSDNEIIARSNNTSGVTNTFTLTTKTKILFRLAVTSAGATGNITVYPMCCLPSIKDTSYVPFAMSNRQLTDYAATVKNELKFVITVPNSVTTIKDVLKHVIDNLPTTETNRTFLIYVVWTAHRTFPAMFSLEYPNISYLFGVYSDKLYSVRKTGTTYNYWQFSGSSF